MVHAVCRCVPSHETGDTHYPQVIHEKDEEKINKIVEFAKQLGGVETQVVEDAAESKTIVSLKINYKKEIVNE